LAIWFLGASYALDEASTLQRRQMALHLASADAHAAREHLWLDMAAQARMSYEV
jgi:hypothetical protein